ncbi:MAG: hypothetical protein AAGC47_12315 [Bacteroidota bacterium]
MRNAILLLSITILLFACDKDDDNPSNSSTPAENNLPERYKSLKGIFNGNGIGAAATLGEGVILFFNQDGDQYAWYENQEIKVVRNVDDSESIFRNGPFTSIGAAARTSQGRLALVNSTGNLFYSVNFTPSSIEGGWSNPDLITSSDPQRSITFWGESGGNTISFNTVSVLWNLTRVGDECLEAEVEFERVYMANGVRNEMQPYFTPGDFYSDGPFNINLWRATNRCGGNDGTIPFTSISAAARNIRSNSVEEILFNADGTQFCFYTVGEGVVSEIYDLY